MTGLLLPSRLPEKQRPLPGLEGYVCTFQCLTHCPFPADSCIWSDPGAEGDDFQYPEFFWWRLSNLPEGEKMDSFYKEPDDKMQLRCPRCLSTDLVFTGYLRSAVCVGCQYDESLIDFPENVGRCV